MNLCVRVSSNVLLLPRRAATRSCTFSFSCSSSALNPSSDLAKAKVSLPVVGLTFMGGFTPNCSNSSANLGFDMRSAFSTLALVNKASLRERVSIRCCSNRFRSRSKIGSINIRSVRSISLSSFFGNPLTMMEKSLYVRSTSLIQ
jgi:hypothetical protein